MESKGFYYPDGYATDKCVFLVILVLENHPLLPKELEYTARELRNYHNNRDLGLGLRTGNRIFQPNCIPKAGVVIPIEVLRINVLLKLLRVILELWM
jgi:hypothetical protein